MNSNNNRYYLEFNNISYQSTDSLVMQEAYLLFSDHY